MEQTLMDKLTILADSAKYDVACTSSGASRTARPGTVGSCYAPGCCHAFTADGRCVSLLKVLMTNCCSFDCGYCVNRRSNDIPRATFAPRELAELTMEFYRRNYIEGLFLSSAVLGTPDYTTERMLAVLLHEGHSTRLLELAAPLELPPPSAREQQFQALWTQFYKTLEIKARHNEKGRMTHCPKRFWADMVELQGEL